MKNEKRKKLELDVFVGLKKANFLFYSKFETLIKGKGLTESTYNILRILRGAKGEGLPCHEISSRMLSRVPDVTRVIDRLVGLKFVIRERDIKDRRIVIQKITAEGLTVLKEMDDPMDETHREIFKSFKKNELDELVLLLGKFLENK
ncbi:MAG: MarR family transcriptional regulator [Planctomycetota bacterium]|nr:MAG: MarR family transcriptional regulator [Planctomycetota bacterium]